MLPREIHVDALCEVRDFRRNHIRRQIGQELLAAVLTPETSRIFSHLATTVFTHASRVENTVIVLYAGYVAVQEEKVVLISVVFIAKTFVDLADEV